MVVTLRDTCTRFHYWTCVQGSTWDKIQLMIDKRFLRTFGSVVIVTCLCRLCSIRLWRRFQVVSKLWRNFVLSVDCQGWSVYGGNQGKLTRSLHHQKPGRAEHLCWVQIVLYIKANKQELDPRHNNLPVQHALIIMIMLLAFNSDFKCKESITKSWMDVFRISDIK